MKATLQKILNKKNVLYLVGFIEDEEFWCSKQVKTLAEARQYVKTHTLKDKTFHIVKKEVIYSPILNLNTRTM
jgi:hypothetical protein